MQHAPSRFSALPGLAVVVAMLAAFGLVSGARAQEDNNLASITLYAAICPVGYADDDYFDDCFGNPANNVTFVLDETTTATTGASGTTAFEGLDAEGEYLVQLDVPGDFTDFVAYCSDEFGDPFDFVYATEVGGIVVDLTLEDDIRCDFYIIPEDASGGPTPTPAPTRAPGATATVGTLPNTGAGPSSGDGSALWSLAGALGLVVVAGVALGRGRLARAAIRSVR